MGTYRKDRAGTRAPVSVGDEEEAEHPEIADASQKISELEQRLGVVSGRVARGTGDVIEQAAEALRRLKEVEEPETVRTEMRERLHVAVILRSLVEEALAHASLGVTAIAERVNEPAGRVIDVLRVLRAENRIYNMGTEDAPKWTLRVGRGVTTQELRAVVGRLISERPMSADELAEATGATTQRVTMAVTAIRMGGAHVLCTETQDVLRWFRVPEGSRLVTPRTRRTTKRRQ
jgi:hypothetical protein